MTRIKKKKSPAKRKATKRPANVKGKAKPLTKYFGILKRGIDGLKYQKEIRGGD